MASATMPPFVGAAYLYHKAGDGPLMTERAETEDSYVALWEAGWRASPADFGVETHPSQPAQPVALPGADPQMASLAQLVADVQATVLTLQTKMLDVVERLGAVEAQQRAAAESEHEQSSQRRR